MRTIKVDDDVGIAEEAASLALSIHDASPSYQCTVRPNTLMQSGCQCPASRLPGSRTMHQINFYSVSMSSLEYFVSATEKDEASRQ